MGITSYAQNFEDVILWRALGAIENGVYIDVGAQHPIIDSVSRAFYENGWRGIHVEPVPSFAELLRRDRPDEIVIEAALASEPGTSRFFEVVGTGLSTADPQIAQHHREQGWPVREITVATLTLDDVFGLAQDGIIHWLKIDVEGFEREVLLGWRTSTRPWVVVIESTFPNSQVETHEKWENLLLQKGYALVYRDGLNRYYLSPDHIELAAAFQFGPNIFDGFQIAESHWAVAEIRHRFESFKQTFHEQARSREAELHAQAEARLEAAQLRWKAEEDALNDKLTQYAAQTQALAQHIQAMQSTLWWRLSVPFRRRSRWRLTDVSNAIRNSTHGGS
jgi:FkbM family methyltransferase